MKVNTLKLAICALVIIIGNDASHLYGMHPRRVQDVNAAIYLSRDNIKGVTRWLNSIYDPTIKAVIYGGLFATSPVVWDIAATLMTHIISPFATISYYATNPATAIIVPLILNPFIDNVIKPLPNSLHHENWPNQAQILKNIFLKEYRCIDTSAGQKSCSRFMWNPEECVASPQELQDMKKATAMAHLLRGSHRVINNKIAATVVGIQLLFTFYALVSTLKAKSLDNRTKGLATFAALYTIVDQLHECTNIKYFSKEGTAGVI
jgi:hypothetical protein